MKLDTATSHKFQLFGVHSHLKPEGKSHQSNESTHWATNPICLHCLSYCILQTIFLVSDHDKTLNLSKFKYSKKFK